MPTNGETTPLRPRELTPGHERDNSLIRRSWHAMSEVLSPFSPSALASLPKKTFTRRPRYTRADNVPEVEQDEQGQMPSVRDYHSINSVPPQVRVPKKIATPIKVEGKVWFANERTWVSYLNIAILVGTLSLALFNASKDQIARNMAYTYAAISVGTLIYGYAVYQRRITMIRKRDPGHFDQILGPIVISALLFFAVLANFIIRVRELRRKEVPIPGQSFFFSSSS
ncbi:VTC1 family protein [Phanerochaete sordida]|uniref:VTC1 family protein n=1 Tax=Phanerochaete sordida TaxID=48140 RepID=A0A9P3G0P4_9APHY|nr:VTC1 family protein [Phanerochaete sordida]